MQYLALFGVILGAISIVAAGSFFVLRHFYYEQRRNAANYIRDLVSPGDDGGPSTLALFVDQAGQIIGARTSQSLKAVFMGTESKTAQAEKDLQLDIIQDKNPIFGAIVDSFPRAARRLRKNPALAAIAAQVIQGMAKAGPQNGQGRPDAMSTQQILDLFGGEK